MSRQRTENTPAVNIALQKPESPTTPLHILLSQIEEDLPTFAFKGGLLIRRSALGEELACRYPGLKSTQRKKIVRQLWENYESVENIDPKSQLSGNASIHPKATCAQQTSKATNTAVSNSKKPGITGHQGARLSPKKVHFALESEQSSTDSASVTTESDSSFDSSSECENTAVAQMKRDPNEESIKSSTMNKFLGNLKISKSGSFLASMQGKSALELQICLIDDGDGEEIEGEALTHKIKNAIIFSGRVLEEHKNMLPQYGLIGRITSKSHSQLADSRLFLNTNIPFSAFICGVQGSGKSHTTACMIENCIIPSPILGDLPKPLSALVFNFAEFNSRANFRPSEVAFLASSNHQNPTQLRATKVKVLVSPSNYHNLADLYTQIPGVEVHQFKIHPKDLNISIMLTLMSVDNTQSAPLYLGTVTKILRQMATKSGGHFDYAKFRRLLNDAGLDRKQMDFLEQRLDLLESFLDLAGDTTRPTFNAGEITIIDLSCPFIDANTACVLFKIGMGIYLDSSTEVGKLIVLGEAHKYMTDSVASRELTESLLALIRQQRHYGVRVLISTQEPTISPRLIDLCSMTVIHRFSSPDWMKVLKRHVSFSESGESNDDEGSLFHQILRLRTGEALVFAPSAIIGRSPDVHEAFEDKHQDWDTVANELIPARIRKRVTWDGGASIVCI